MLNAIGVKNQIIDSVETLRVSDKLILPGVGSFDHGMSNLTNSGLTNALEQAVLERKVPFLGICLGAQLLTSKSEEGVIPGLNWIEAKTIRFRPKDLDIKVPHMGWNTVTIKNKSKLFDDKADFKKYYFAHNYYIRATSSNQVIATTDHGNLFDSVIQKDNIIGVQFHPEKSHRFGMKLLENFITRF